MKNNLVIQLYFKRFRSLDHLDLDCLGHLDCLDHLDCSDHLDCLELLDCYDRLECLDRLYPQIVYILRSFRSSDRLDPQII